MLAAGDFYGNWGQDPKAVSLFDITAVFPVGFAFRNADVSPVIAVSRVPNGLQPDLESYLDRTTPATADALMTTDTTAITLASARMSSTAAEYIKEYATGASNLWKGAIFEKLLGYVLLLLLRLRLAPRREQQHKARVQAAAQRKREDAKRKRDKRAVYKAIDNLQAHEPQTAHTTLPDLQLQLAQLTAGDDASGTEMTGVVMTDGGIFVARSRARQRV
ncbi:hypothetical protein BGZ75_000292 [Mortierella antarctica]|nr:hypothetical protein BGZ75_000292 [Mortierella antarctica]